MNLFLRIGRVTCEPWPRRLWAASIARALAARGHTIAVVAGSDQPLPRGLTSITRHDARGRTFDARLSLHPAAPEELWLPLGENAVESLNPRGVLRPWRMLGEPEPRPLPRATGRVRMALAFDDAHAERIAARHPALRDRVRTVGWASGSEPDAARRDEARAALGLDQETLALVYLGGRRAGAIEETALRAFAGCLGEWRRRVTLLTATPSSLASRRRATLARCAVSVRALGPTRRLDDLLLAADAAIALGTPRDLHIGDFLAASLRVGTPALAARSTPGSGLLLPGAGKGDAPGVVVDRIDVECLRRGLVELLTEPRLESCRRAAESAERIQSLDQFAARLEEVCAGKEPAAAEGAEAAAPEADRRTVQRAGTNR